MLTSPTVQPQDIACATCYLSERLRPFFTVLLSACVLASVFSSDVTAGDRRDPIWKDAADDPSTQPSVDSRCNLRPWQRPLKEDLPFGALHDVVGQDGVLMISMERSAARFDNSAKTLALARIFPTKFAATDGACETQEQLKQGCYAADDADIQEKCVGGKQINEKSLTDKSGNGCTSTEQAIAESHRRALEAALKRDNDWTAILEEDAVPVRPERWDKAFEEAWAGVPKEIKIVRLSYCVFENAQFEIRQQIYQDTGDFMLANWAWAPNNTYNPTGCTGGYIVHRDIIPEMLGLFPCCCAIDCCLEWDFFNKKANEEHTLSRGMQVLLSMDAWGSTEYANNFLPYPMNQKGVLVQDCREVQSFRWRELIGENTFGNVPSEETSDPPEQSQDVDRVAGLEDTPASGNGDTAVDPAPGQGRWQRLWELLRNARKRLGVLQLRKHRGGVQDRRDDKSPRDDVSMQGSGTENEKEATLRYQDRQGDKSPRDDISTQGDVTEKTREATPRHRQMITEHGHMSNRLSDGTPEDSHYAGQLHHQQFPEPTGNHGQGEASSLSDAQAWVGPTSSATDQNKVGMLHKPFWQEVRERMAEGSGQLHHQQFPEPMGKHGQGVASSLSDAQASVGPASSATDQNVLGVLTAAANHAHVKADVGSGQLHHQRFPKPTGKHGQGKASSSSDAKASVAPTSSAIDKRKLGMLTDAVNHAHAKSDLGSGQLHHQRFPAPTGKHGQGKASPLSDAKALLGPTSSATEQRKLGMLTNTVNHDAHAKSDLGSGQVRHEQFPGTTAKRPRGKPSPLSDANALIGGSSSATVHASSARNELGMATDGGDHARREADPGEGQVRHKRFPGPAASHSQDKTSPLSDAKALIGA